jgi:hypothetical protein
VLATINSNLEDEAERSRASFPGAHTLGTAPHGEVRTPTTPHTPTTPGGSKVPVFTFSQPAAAQPGIFDFDISKAPGITDPEYCHPQHLQELKAELPALTKSGLKPDSFFLRMKVSTLLKLESNVLKRTSQDKNRTVEDTLAANQEAIASNPISVEAGFDDRLSTLHPARFLPGPICTAQDLWLQARKVWGTTGFPPVAAFDMASIGLSGHITPKGFAALQDPSSTALSLRLFDVRNVTNKVEANKRISLAAGDTMEVGESLQELTSLYAFQQSLRAVRELARLAMPWNGSFAALEGFLVNNIFMARDLGHNLTGPGIGILARFCDYVFALNSQRWRAGQCFLDTTELAPTWSNWLASRGGPIIQRAASNTAAAGGDGAQKAAKAARPKQKATATSSTARAAIKAAAPLPPDDICQRFNKNKCPNQVTGNCTTANGMPLRHVCNYMTTPTTKCMQPHARILNH